MPCPSTKKILRDALRETTLALTGVFDLFDASPDLVEATAEALGKVYRAHLDRAEPERPASGNRPLAALLDELDSGDAPATGSGPSCACHRS